MDLIVLFLAAICSPVPDGVIVPRFCASEGASICCEYAYIVDRFCCHTADDPDCEDDCTEAERQEDAQNALWTSERHCIHPRVLFSGACASDSWKYNGGGFEHYDREPTLWNKLVWWMFPDGEPFDEYLECLKYGTHPHRCEGE